MCDSPMRQGKRRAVQAARAGTYHHCSKRDKGPAPYAGHCASAWRECSQAHGLTALPSTAPGPPFTQATLILVVTPQGTEIMLKLTAYREDASQAPGGRACCSVQAAQTCRVVHP